MAYHIIGRLQIKIVQWFRWAARSREVDLFLKVMSIVLLIFGLVGDR
jgi:hypothetical protein